MELLSVSFNQNDSLVFIKFMSSQSMQYSKSNKLDC